MRGSDFYGIQRTLLRYAHLPHLGVFPYSVQHGWQHAASGFEAGGNPLEIWVWSDRARNEMGTHYPLNRIRVVGSPYLYLDDHSDPVREKMRGSLFLLPHSSHMVRIGFSHDDLRNLLAHIGGVDGGCDVLAYYLDATTSLCAVLRSTGARMLVNGGLWSADFMSVFRQNIRMYERIYFSNFGSAVLFARHESRETRYVDLSSHVVASSNKYVDQLGKNSTYDPTGEGMDTGTELGIGQTIGSAEMRELVLQGLRRVPPRALMRHAVAFFRSMMVDHYNNVRPSLALAARHNALLGD